MAKRYPEEFKHMIVEQYQLGGSVKEVCAQHNITRSTLLLWVKQYTADETGKIPRERYLLEKEVKLLFRKGNKLNKFTCPPVGQT